jgi:sugar phosphate isomerase/epimerase
MHELSLAAGTLPEFNADIVAEAAGEAGFSLVGFTVGTDWDADMTRRVQARLKRWQLSVLDVEVLWIPQGGRLDGGHRRIVEIGGELAARNVLVVSSEADTGRTADALQRICEWAAPHGMRVALEFLMITAIRTPAAALAVVRACDHPGAAVLIDTLHLARAGAGPETVAAIPPELLPYVQFCDGPATCRDDHEHYLEDALDLRSAPGEGELPLDAVLRGLPDACPLSLEIRSSAYRQRFPDPAERAAAVRRPTLEFLNRR